jgi:hypothetical protein
LPITHLSIQLGLGRRAATKGSFSFNITILILNNVVVNHFISFKGVRVELFPLPPKPSGCDFMQRIDDYMTVKDEEYVAWVNKCSAMRKGASSSN